MPNDHDIWKPQERGKAWKGAGLYHVTLTVPSREPLLGELVIPEQDPKLARVDVLPLGRTLLDIQKNHLPSFYPEIQILHYCLMPDHLHAVWYVRHTMPRGIQSALRGFWQMAKKAGRAYTFLSSFTRNSIPGENKEIAAIMENLRNEIGADTYDTLPPIFTEMPFLRPMGHKDQLPTTIRYIDMNPQRLATKRLKPGFFRVQDNISIAGRIYSGVGNAKILQAEHYAPVHVRHTMVEAAEHGDDQALRDYMNSCVLAARKGTVMVSPFISPQEQAVMAVLLKENLPFIYLADNGFRDYYKPQDSLFDAVAAGRVLILSPWDYDPTKRHVSRADCVALNSMAEEISTLSSLTPELNSGKPTTK